MGDNSTGRITGDWTPKQWIMGEKRVDFCFGPHGEELYQVWEKEKDSIKYFVTINKRKDEPTYGHATDFEIEYDESTVSMVGIKDGEVYTSEYEDATNPVENPKAMTLEETLIVQEQFLETLKDFPKEELKKRLISDLAEYVSIYEASLFGDPLEPGILLRDLGRFVEVY
ncbi:hypothetical protein KY347_02235 [Candidatus Woesearchaeota archaeon]|nr:hypothetical protein [Candidatus Woesearchaeota archaeon]